MNEANIEKLKAFLARTPVLVAHIDTQAKNVIEAAHCERLAKVHTGTPMTEEERQISALSGEFQKRIETLCPTRAIVVLDRYHDHLDSFQNIDATITSKYLARFGNDGSRAKPFVAISIMAYITDAGVYHLGPQEGFQNHISYVFPEPAYPSAKAMCAFYLRIPEERIRDDLPFSRAGISRLTLAHEVLGHTTERTVVHRTNNELRADIAGMTESFRVSANLHDATFDMLHRNFAELRDFVQNPQKNADSLTIYGNSIPLKKTFNKLATMPNIHQMDDHSLLALVDATHEDIILSDAPLQHLNVLKSAQALVHGAQKNDWWHLEELFWENPKRLGDTIAFLASCMEGYNFFIKPEAPALKADYKLPTPKISP
ncbi:MAG TPA: hypothetical protein DCW68_04360 [Rhodospirillaceae bacterium]|nr:MAG: hypothetical protein A2018_03290 [Alphaproteobacteria bacterium GWF2_58_20]HAU29329.1 hypothetical protein [Rhodospirillaceae bacterium]